jgi:hypothetical protein
VPKIEGLPNNNTGGASTLELDKVGDKERVTIKVSVPFDSQKSNRHWAEFTVTLVLDPSATAGAWRMPAAPSASRSMQQENTKPK